MSGKITKIISVVGARPNFMKISPFINEVISYNKKYQNKIKHILVHTGQHYDDRMSQIFFDLLKIPYADLNLEIGSGSHAEQVGNTMIEFEKVLIREKPDWVVVVGDVNATLACSVTAKKLNIKVCHIEAGLRSRDNSMPEEINRLVTDRLSDLLLVPDKISLNNLLQEGVGESKIKFVGNIMIDTLDNNIEKASQIDELDIVERNKMDNQENKKFNKDDSFGLITMHRPSNVDKKNILSPIINFFENQVTKNMNLIWPLHPRTENQLKINNLYKNLIDNEKIFLLKPINYHEMIKLNMKSKIMFTDSGGLQEECTVLGTPCLTLRFNTERPITLCENNGVSLLTGNHISEIQNQYMILLKKEIKAFRPQFWDGKTANRCLNEILSYK